MPTCGLVLYRPELIPLMLFSHYQDLPASRMSLLTRRFPSEHNLPLSNPALQTQPTNPLTNPPNLLLKRLRDLIPPRCRVRTEATPFANRARDLWQLLNFLQDVRERKQVQTEDERPESCLA